MKGSHALVDGRFQNVLRDLHQCVWLLLHYERQSRRRRTYPATITLFTSWATGRARVRAIRPEAASGSPSGRDGCG